ncbi:MAG: hypothetical protein KDC33_04995, partial [Thermoleophilia bacterium]|nr:hypothetical protein [Thermoleophilia bacterium]
VLAHAPGEAAELTGDADATRSRHAAVAAELAAARERYGTRSGEVAERRGRVTGDAARVEADAAQLEADRAALGAWSTYADPSGALAEARRAVADAEAAAHEAQNSLVGASREADEGAAAAERIAREDVQRLRLAAARAADVAGLDEPALPGEPHAAVAALEPFVRLLEAARDDARRRAQESSEAADAALRAFNESSREGGVADPATLDAARDQAGRALGDARAALASVASAAYTAGQYARGARADAREAGLFHQIAQDLRANGFPRYLLGRFRERLATGASVRLQELSHGAYRFAAREPDPLAVVDLRRGEKPRAASTLSGGERFLASLALALGLSDIAAESGGRLECLFLDEGFSTLDADSLEQALAGVERLSGDGRLIAVITHLPGVADRLGATLRVTKDAEGVSHVAAPVAAG